MHAATPLSYLTPPVGHASCYGAAPLSHTAGNDETDRSLVRAPVVSGWTASPSTQMSAQIAGSPSGALEAALVVDTFKPDERTVTRRTLAFAHTAVLVALFFPPFVVSLSLGFNDEVAYFAGRRNLFPILLLPLLVVVPIVHLVARPNKGMFYLATVLIPAIVFASVGGVMREHTEIAANAMYNRDCYTFVEKRSLFRAYQAALEVNGNCQGTDTSIEHCRGYDAVQKTYARELKYLSSLEHRFPCAGICHAAIQLFEHPGEEAPTCRLFVAQWLKGASEQSCAMLWYAVFIMLISYPSWHSLVKPMVKRVQ